MVTNYKDCRNFIGVSEFCNLDLRYLICRISFEYVAQAVSILRLT